MAGYFRANQKHELLDSYGIDFFRAKAELGYPRWPGRSCNFNPAENIGAIVMDRVEAALRKEEHPGRRDTMIRVITSVCESLEYAVDLFEPLLRSFWRRMELGRAVGGKSINEY